MYSSLNKFSPLTIDNEDLPTLGWIKIILKDRFQSDDGINDLGWVLAARSIDMRGIWVPTEELIGAWEGNNCAVHEVWLEGYMARVILWCRGTAKSNGYEKKLIDDIRSWLEPLEHCSVSYISKGTKCACGLYGKSGMDGVFTGVLYA